MTKASSSPPEFDAPSIAPAGEGRPTDSTPVDGSEPATLVIETGGSIVHQYEISPDGQSVVFISPLDTYQVYELYRIPILGGQRTRLNPAFAGGQDVQDFVIDASSTWVAYRADAEVNNQNYLYGAPLDGSSPAVKLSHPMTGPEEVREHRS